MSRLLALLILAVVGTGCATAHVVVPPAPPATAPDAERVAWAERYSLVPGVLGDTIGTGEVVRDLSDLKTGISDPIVVNHLEQLESYSLVHTLSSVATVVTAVAAVGGLIVTPSFEREYGFDDPVAIAVGTATTAAVVGFVVSSLWSNSVNYSMEQIRGRLRLAYGHAIEDELNVEIHPNGHINARAPLVPAQTANPAAAVATDPLPPVLTPPAEQLAPTPAAEPTTVTP